MDMEFFQVLLFGKTTKPIKKKNFIDEEVEVPADVPVYFVNTKFSVPNCGFIMTADGVVTTKSINFDGTLEDVKKFAAAAKDKIAKGELNELNMKFNI